jgi:DNA gyrase subunit A
VDGEEMADEATDDTADTVTEDAVGDEPTDDSAEQTEAGVERSGMRYRKQRRGGKGVRDIRTNDRNGLVVGIASVHDDDDIMLITAQGMVNRTHVSEIRVVGRNTQGVRIMNLNEGDTIASLAKIAREEEPETPVDETSAGAPEQSDGSGDGDRAGPSTDGDALE